ncbi:hypothetical protein [Burkholderia sp. ABCPW 11]|uniref:hypothetical protein n=1 Tax=Burkholderia sp. ABCPW 11 TaxID=1637859 RepID=UPI00211D6A51|nr:hypothetical protein [Burkholderia sp. ABCPW 11]
MSDGEGQPARTIEISLNIRIGRCATAHGVRHRGYGKFQIFYRVKGDPSVQIDVLHVLHGARDCTSILF